MSIELDGRLLTNREALHSFFAQQLSFPEYYGRNLDALYDCLSELSKETEILVTHITDLDRNLGAYGSSVLAVLQDAARENSRLVVKFEKNASEL